MASCPTCQKDVDPLRAPSARVIGGRIVAFCSAACAEAGVAAGAPSATEPARAAAPAASPAPSPPAPVRPATPGPATPPAPVAPPAKAAPAAPAAPASSPTPPPPGAAAAKASAVASIPPGPTAVPALAADERPRSQRITNPVEPDDVLEETPAPPRASAPGRPRARRGLVLMFAGAIVIGGMAIAIVQAVSPSKPERAGAEPAPPALPPAAPAPTPAPSPAQAAAAARAALAELLDGESERVQRIAAAALARTGDTASVDKLAEMLAREANDITRLDIAYALGRAGDARGVAALSAAAKGGRRDVKADAGRMLILLGDPGGEGAKALASFLDMRNLRLGAAEALARAADDKAVGVLTAIHDDPAAAADDRIRAAIALGRARRKEVASELEQLLADGRFNAFAAAALADLGDVAARPVLVKQLEVPSLRVGAAVALRRLEPGLDPAPLLPPLLSALAADKDVARVGCAEAILVLTGPPAWAERD